MFFLYKAGVWKDTESDNAVYIQMNIPYNTVIIYLLTSELVIFVNNNNNVLYCNRNLEIDQFLICKSQMLVVPPPFNNISCIALFLTFC